MDAFERRLVLIATGIDNTELDRAVVGLRTDGVHADNGGYLAKSIEVPVQLFIAAGVGYFSAVFAKYIEIRLQKQGPDGNPGAGQSAARPDRPLDEMSIAFAQHVFKNIPESVKGEQAYLAIGISIHGPWGVHLPLNAQDQQDTIAKIAWMARNCGDVELALEWITDSGHKAFGQYILEVIAEQQFSLTWRQFEPAHSFQAVCSPSLPIAVTNQTTGETNLLASPNTGDSVAEVRTPSAEMPDNPFEAGWEYANWLRGSECPTSNFVLAEFSQSLSIQWPPESKLEDLPQRYEASLSRTSAGSAAYKRFEFGWQSSVLLSEISDFHKKNRKVKSASGKRIRIAQNKLAVVLQDLRVTAESRNEFVQSAKELFRFGPEERAVSGFFAAVNRVLDELEPEHTSDAEESAAAMIHLGIITIRDDEHRAVLARFPPDREFKGRRTYSCCTIDTRSGQSISVAVVRALSQGQGHAQDAARDLIEDFDPRCLMLVGICGAVPTVDCSLGDVILANRVADFSVRCEIAGQPTEYSQAGGPMHRGVQDLLASLAASEGAMSGWNSDQEIGKPVPQAVVDQANLYGDASWVAKVKACISSKFENGKAKRVPRAIVGNAGSSDALVKSPDLVKEWLSSSRHVTSIEMELGGVYIAARRLDGEIPILAIRGISDIVGHKRENAWTEYACESAASFAGSLVRSGCLNSLLS